MLCSKELCKSFSANAHKVCKSRRSFPKVCKTANKLVGPHCNTKKIHAKYPLSSEEKCHSQNMHNIAGGFPDILIIRIDMQNSQEQQHFGWNIKMAR